MRLSSQQKLSTSAVTGLLPLLWPTTPPLTSHFLIARGHEPLKSPHCFGETTFTWIAEKKLQSSFLPPLLNAEGKCCTAQGYQQGSNEQQMLLVINQQHQLDFQGYMTIKGNLKGRKSQLQMQRDALKQLMVVVLLMSKEWV